MQIVLAFFIKMTRNILDKIVDCVDKVDILINKNPSGNGMSGRVLSPFGKSATLTKARGEGLWIADFNSLFIYSNKDLKIIRTAEKKSNDRIVKLAEIGGNSQVSEYIVEMASRKHCQQTVVDWGRERD